MSSPFEIGPSRASVGTQAWNAVVEDSPDGWVWSLYEWLDVIENVQGWPLEDRSFTILRGDEVVAVVPLHLIRPERRMEISGWGPTCPAIVGSLSPGDRAKCQTVVAKHLRDLAEQLKCVRIDLAVHPLSATSLSARWGVNPLLPYQGLDVSGHSQVVDLRAPVDSLWSSLSATSRSKIRKSMKAGYSVACEEWSEHVDTYMRLHEETYVRSGVTPVNRDYFSGIAARIAPRGNARLLVARDRSGKVVGYHSQACFGSGAMYKSGCSASQTRDDGVNYLLMWSSMLDAKQSGRDWYECGEIFLSRAADKNAGLTFFKQRFGGEPHRYFRLRIEVDSPTSDRWISRLTSRQRSEA